MSFLDKFKVSDLGEDDLRNVVDFLIKKEVITEREVIGTLIAQELSAASATEGGAKGGDGNTATASPKRGNGKTRRGSKLARKRAGAGSKSAGAGAASRILQGKYLGAIRLIPKSQRGKYKAIAKESGREAAIKAIKAAVLG